ncbi:hypothetical protein LEJE111609_20365 [Lelliottia jeotgali]
MVTRQVIIHEGVSAEHPVITEPADTEPQIRLGAFIRTVKTALSESKQSLLLIEWHQQVELGVFKREIPVGIQLYARGPKLRHPLLHFTGGGTCCHTASHCRRSIRTGII